MIIDSNFMFDGNTIAVSHSVYIIILCTYFADRRKGLF